MREGALRAGLVVSFWIPRLLCIWRGTRKDEDTLATMIVVLESGIESVRNGESADTGLCGEAYALQASPTGDPRFRLEKFLAELVRSLFSSSII